MLLAHDFETRYRRRVIARVSGFRLGKGKDRVLDDRVTHTVDLLGGAESERVVLPFGRSVNPGALGAIERKLLLIAGHPVLPELGADGLEPVADVAHDGKVVLDGLFPLENVAQRDGDQKDDEGSDQR